MKQENKVFIATSLDGFIADQKGGLDWLHDIQNPEQIDMGYGEFTGQIDALVMGRTTFETVCSFDVPWPYQKPVFVLSNTLTHIPDSHQDKAYLVNGSLTDVLEKIHGLGYHQLYIDGGKTIQSFLREDLIDSMVITTIPTLLGGGHPLFSSLDLPLKFKCVKTTIFLDAIVQNTYVRLR